MNNVKSNNLIWNIEGIRKFEFVEKHYKSLNSVFSLFLRLRRNSFKYFVLQVNDSICFRSLGETGANLASSGACIEALVYLDKLIQESQFISKYIIHFYKRQAQVLDISQGTILDFVQPMLIPAHPGYQRVPLRNVSKFGPAICPAIVCI